MALTFDDFDIGDKIQCDHDKNTYEITGKCKNYHVLSNVKPMDVVFCPHNGVTFDFDISVLNSLNVRIVEKSKAKTPAKTGCDCDILVLMRAGCQCKSFSKGS